jgi:hypothetical protein
LSTAILAIEALQNRMIAVLDALASNSRAIQRLGLCDLFLFHITNLLVAIRSGWQEKTRSGALDLPIKRQESFHGFVKRNNEGVSIYRNILIHGYF